jgi:hypothetical protein
MSTHRCPADDDAAIRNVLGPGTGTRHLMTLLTVEVADALLGALLYFALARHEPITARHTHALLDLVLSGIGTGLPS